MAALLLSTNWCPLPHDLDLTRPWYRCQVELQEREAAEQPQPRADAAAQRSKLWEKGTGWNLRSEFEVDLKSTWVDEQNWLVVEHLECQNGACRHCTNEKQPSIDLVDTFCIFVFGLSPFRAPFPINLLAPWQWHQKCARSEQSKLTLRSQKIGLLLPCRGCKMISYVLHRPATSLVLKFANKHKHVDVMYINVCIYIYITLSLSEYVFVCHSSSWCQGRHK